MYFKFTSNQRIRNPFTILGNSWLQRDREKDLVDKEQSHHRSSPKNLIWQGGQTSPSPPCTWPSPNRGHQGPCGQCQGNQSWWWLWWCWWLWWRWWLCKLGWRRWWWWCACHHIYSWFYLMPSNNFPLLISELHHIIYNVSVFFKMKDIHV